MEARHRILQLRAARWLESLGYSVGIEVSIPMDKRRYKYRVDVYGKLNGKQCAVEVGGTKPDRLNELLRLFDEVYIWPFSSNEPIKWSDNMQLCHICGGVYADYQFCDEKDIQDLRRYRRWNFYNSIAICEYCGKEYPRRRKLQRFCSKRCRKNWWIAQRHNGHDPNYGVADCVICETEFQKTRPWSKYCSTCRKVEKRST